MCATGLHGTTKKQNIVNLVFQKKMLAVRGFHRVPETGTEQNGDTHHHIPLMRHRRSTPEILTGMPGYYKVPLHQPVSAVSANTESVSMHDAVSAVVQLINEEIGHTDTVATDWFSVREIDIRIRRAQREPRSWSLYTILANIAGECVRNIAERLAMTRQKDMLIHKHIVGACERFHPISTGIDSRVSKRYRLHGWAHTGLFG